MSHHRIIMVSRCECALPFVVELTQTRIDFHDFAMIAYVVLTLPWMLGTISSTPTKRVRTVTRRYVNALNFVFGRRN